MRRTTFTLLLLSALFAGASCHRLGRDWRQNRQSMTPTTPSPPPPFSSPTFPPYETTLELLTLSSTIYKYRGLGASSCDDIVRPNVTYPLPPRSSCHLYERDAQDTQVMIVSRPIVAPAASSSAEAETFDEGGGGGGFSGGGTGGSPEGGYVAVVYAGTDDFRNVLTDGDIIFKPFGPTDANGTSNHPYVPPSDPDIEVHAGFDHAVFHDGLFDRVVATVRSVLDDHPNYQLLTTGHSLGAADSVLTTVALSQRFGPTRPILNVNFGCPRTGNRPWRDYVNSLSSHVSIWRFVNSVDIVPRLPTGGLFVHVGHTVQMSGKGCHAYYLHDGDVDLGLRGVPLGWEVAPFVIVPYNGICHFISKYRAYLFDKSGPDRETYYVKDFARVGQTDDDDDTIPEDDVPPDPPDDDFDSSRYDGGDGAVGSGPSLGEGGVYDPRVRVAIAREVSDWYAERVGDGDGDGLYLGPWTRGSETSLEEFEFVDEAVA